MSLKISQSNPVFSYYDESARYIGECLNGDDKQKELEEKAFSLRVSRPWNFRVYVKKTKTVGFWRWKREVIYWDHEFTVGMWWCDEMPKKEGFVSSGGSALNRF